MAEPIDPVAEFKRVRIQAQKIRADAIRSRIQTAQLFCALAESQTSATTDHARTILSKVIRSIAEIEHHITEPDHVSRASADELKKLLSELKTRVDRIGNSL